MIARAIQKNNHEKFRCPRTREYACSWRSGPGYSSQEQQLERQEHGECECDATSIQKRTTRFCAAETVDSRPKDKEDGQSRGLARCLTPAPGLIHKHSSARILSRHSVVVPAFPVGESDAAVNSACFGSLRPKLLSSSAH